MSCNAIVEVSGKLVGVMDVVAIQKEGNFSDAATLAYLNDIGAPERKPYRAQCVECLGGSHKIILPNGEPVYSEIVVGYAT